MIENCPMRHENGNCIPAGGFCTANKNICEALRNAYRMGKAQLFQQGTTSDLISRQQALKALIYAVKNVGVLDANDIRTVFKALPTAQPERQRGEWIYNSPVTMKCDQCGLVIKDWDWHRFKICPNCGADMRGKKDG